MPKKKLLVKGPKVQEVGYRLFLYSKAEELCLDGFQARNVGMDVEVLIEGEEEQIRQFISFVEEEYPRHAKVSEITIKDYDGKIPKIETYYRALTAEQLGKMVDVGLTLVSGQNRMLEKQDAMLKKQDLMLEKQDAMLKKQDLMLEKQDAMLKKQDLMLEKQDAMLKKQDEIITNQIRTIDELRELRIDLRAFIDERLAEIRREIDRIKEKVGLS